MHVTREQLETFLDRVRSQTKDPKAGLFGPGSMMWMIGREMIGGLGGGRALLLQTAHPFVAHAVEQHSRVREDPHGRGERTFKNVLAMNFGDLEAALRAARRVHAVHERIHGKITERIGAFDLGTSYDANDDDALLWVHATLWDTSVQMYELIVRPLSSEEKEKYYQETKLFAYLFGVPDRIIPPNWNDFMDYNRKMWESDILTVGKPSAEIAHFVLQPPKPELQPVMDWFKIITAGLMPRRIRHEYRFPYGAAEKAVFEASIRALRAAYPRLHRRLRFSPAYIKARERMGMAYPTGPIDSWLGRFMDRQMGQPGLTAPAAARSAA